MNNAVLVQINQAAQQVHQVPPRHGVVERPAELLQDLGEGAAGHPFLEDVEFARFVVDFGAQVRDDVGVRERRHEIDLAVDLLQLPRDGGLLLDAAARQDKRLDRDKGASV